MEAKPLTAADVDVEFVNVCSQIGNLYCARLDLESQIAQVDGQIEVLKLKRAQSAAQYHALAHNEQKVAS